MSSPKALCFQLAETGAAFLFFVFRFFWSAALFRRFCFSFVFLAFAQQKTRETKKRRKKPPHSKKIEKQKKQRLSPISPTGNSTSFLLIASRL